MGSLTLLPLALEEVEADPSLRMPELKASLFRPLDMLPCSPRGVNLLCRSKASPLVADAPHRVYGTVGGVGVLKRR